MIYLLNETRDEDIVGDISLFHRINGMLQYVEAVDVRNNEYYAYCSDGRRVLLSVSPNSDEVQVTIEEPKDYINAVTRILKVQLKRLAKAPKFSAYVSESAVDASNDAEELVKMVPAEAMS
jgi:hypothetical protein